MKSAIIIIIIIVVTLLSWTSIGFAQERSQDDQPHIVPKNLPAPREEPNPQPQGESSSKDSQVGLEDAGTSASAPVDKSEVHELRPFDPHKAAKDIEVGEYYLKQKNYRAALERFNDALLYKPNDGEATFRLAQTQEKLELYMLAYQSYQDCLKIVQDGPFAKESREAMRRIEPHLPKAQADGKASGEMAQLMQQGEDSLEKNDFESAQENFAKAVEIAPDDPVANFRLAQSLRGLERFDEARTYFKKYLGLQPKGNMASDAKRELAQINFILGKR